MGGAVPPLLKYAFMAWCSVRGSTGATLPLPYKSLIFIFLLLISISLFFLSDIPSLFLRVLLVSRLTFFRLSLFV
jgi:hypothetical protein